MSFLSILFYTQKQTIIYTLKIPSLILYPENDSNDTESNSSAQIKYRSGIKFSIRKRTQNNRPIRTILKNGCNCYILKPPMISLDFISIR
jgi:hypothetical protein